MSLLSRTRSSSGADSQIAEGQSEPQRNQSRSIGTPNYLRTAPETALSENPHSAMAEGTAEQQSISNSQEEVNPQEQQN